MVYCVQIFLRAGQMAELDKIRTELLNRSAVTLQRHARGFVKRSQFQRKRRAIVVLQACSRCISCLLSSHLWRGSVDSPVAIVRRWLTGAQRMKAPKDGPSAVSDQLIAQDACLFRYFQAADTS